jgi:SAM-dependent methyltransferase
MHGLSVQRLLCPVLTQSACAADRRLTWDVDHERVVSEFTFQAEAFNASAVARAHRTLEGLVDLAMPRAADRWIEAACGPGAVSRTLAPRVREVHGMDVTPTMVELARTEAAAASVRNAFFSVGDATDTGLPDAGFDGAITRFSIHHIPLPIRLFEELTRVVRPGGTVVVADHVGDTAGAARAWSQEIERLRDPSHWACLPVAALRALGEQAGLELQAEEIVGFEVDYEDWLRRGSGGLEARALIERALGTAPVEAECFGWGRRDGRRILNLRVWLARWQRRAGLSSRLGSTRGTAL